MDCEHSIIDCEALATGYAMSKISIFLRKIRVFRYENAVFFILSTSFTMLQNGRVPNGVPKMVYNDYII